MQTVTVIICTREKRQMHGASGKLWQCQSEKLIRIPRDVKIPVTGEFCLLLDGRYYTPVFLYCDKSTVTLKMAEEKNA